MGTDSEKENQGEGVPSGARVELEARPERRLIPRGGGERHVDFRVRATEGPDGGLAKRPERMPLGLALVLDRSGSMQGDKLRTAKRAALAVLDALEERDSIALVVFDDKIDTIQPAAPASAQVKARVRSALAEVEARSMTALHEGWLTGCKAVAGEGAAKATDRLARCFLLTDGLANVGLTDPERIAAEAAGVRENAGVSTSTFGVGEDYSEELLGPLAQAGGGSFHHLRAAAEIATTFVGELGQLLTVAAAQARLEIEVEPGTRVEVISGYYAKPAREDGTRWSIALGDLIAGEEHHVVVGLALPAQDGREERGVRARLVWMGHRIEQTTGWQELRFAYADDAACEGERPDPDVARVAGQGLADRAHREAIRLSKSGDLGGARAYLARTSYQVQALASSAPMLEEDLEQLRGTAGQMANAPLPSAQSKERYYQAQRRSSGKRDLRGGQPDPQASASSGDASSGAPASPPPDGQPKP